MEETLYFGLTNLIKGCGYETVLELVRAKAKSLIKTSLFNSQDDANLANLVMKMAKVCRDEDAQKVIGDCLTSLDEDLATIEDYQFLCSTSIKPNLTIMNQDLSFPRLWPSKVIDFYIKVSTAKFSLSCMKCIDCLLEEF